MIYHIGATGSHAGHHPMLYLAIVRHRMVNDDLSAQRLAPVRRIILTSPSPSPFAKTANGMLSIRVHINDVDDEEEIITIGGNT